MKESDVLVSQLTVYERRRLNKQRHCVICNDLIHDYDTISFQKRRDRRKVEYAFCHYKCEIEAGYPDLFQYKGGE